MARKDSAPKTKAPRRWRDLGAAARQANHVVAAAVFVFVASILLQSVLAKPLLSAAGWIHRHWGATGAAIFGPLLLDGPTSLLLIGIAFPFGRVTAARPWVSGSALVLLVHGFWLSFHYVLGQHVLLWGSPLPILGRGALLVLTLLGVVALLKLGRKVALEADGRGISKGPERRPAPEAQGTENAMGRDESVKDSAKKEDNGTTGAGPARAGAEATRAPEEVAPPCKMTASVDVSGGER